MMGIYLVLTTIYSVFLKSYFLLDVILLALLYGWRILAGSVVIGVAASEWLLAFSTFLFLGLALVKRCTELRLLGTDHTTSLSGRNYVSADHGVLQSIGISACLSSVVVFCLFINSDETKDRYATPQALWLVACALLYRSSRLWIKVARNEMHDDPINYALKDRGSRIVLACVVCTMIVAHYLRLGTLAP